jgi:drug/metabolite transporter (DMT)-like permease
VREDSGRPITLIAFLAMSAMVGANVVAVRFSNRELAPFWGGAFRFAIASALMWIVVAIMRLQVPRGRNLGGAVLYGSFSFAFFFACAYWGLQATPAVLAGVILASVPLLTFFIALLLGQERFNPKSLAGGVLAIAGIAVMVRAPINAAVPLLSLLAILGAALSGAGAGIVGRHFRDVNPVVMNAVGMTTGTIFLGILSLLRGEEWVLPSKLATINAVAYLITLGSCGVFLIYLYVLRRWTASAVSYEFVISPVVGALLAAWLLDEQIDAAVGLGGTIVMVGVYIGAVLASRDPAPA